MWAGLCFIVVNASLYIYSYSSSAIFFGEIELKKMVNPASIEEELTAENRPDSQTDNQTKLDSIKSIIQNRPDSTHEVLSALPPPIYSDSLMDGDSTHHRILLLGDSEAGGIKNVLNDYCQNNGHKLVATIEWSSATSINFAKADTISRIIDRYKPTYIMVLFGLNEVLSKDAEFRKNMARLVHKRIKRTPYAWIGPTNWGQDFVVTDAFKAAADSAAFFPSKSLTFSKASDGRHPSLAGYRIWMAYVANWLQTSARWKIKMNRPSHFNYPRKFKTYVFNAAEFRGY